MVGALSTAICYEAENSYILLMNLTRRTFLQTTGAAGLLAASPLGVAAGSQSAGLASAATSDGLWAVVSPGRAWSICENAHYAYHEASMIRHSGAVCSTHVRCTPAFASQVQAGNLINFVEIDGWAVTSSEAEKRGLDFLKNAIDQKKAREQLLMHHLGKLRKKVESFDQNRTDAYDYVRFPGKNWKILDAGRRSEIEPSLHEEFEAADLAWFRCSEALASALQGWVGSGSPEPDIDRTTAFHMLPEERSERLLNDKPFRIAFGGADRQNLDKKTKSTGYIVFDSHTRWVWGAGSTKEDALEAARSALPYSGDLDVLKASPTLVAQVSSNGYEIPSFWQRRGRLARHESEFSRDNTPIRIRRRRLRDGFLFT